MPCSKIKIYFQLLPFLTLVNSLQHWQITNLEILAPSTIPESKKEESKQLTKNQMQLIQREKMSGLAQLVAGLAHEINNSLNFIVGNLDYARNYSEDLLKIIELYQQNYPQPGTKIESATAEIELDYLREDLPKIFHSMKVGSDRIQQIVIGLSKFYRYDEAKMKKADLHQGIDSTLLILQHPLRKGRIKINKKYGNLPQVTCYAGQLNQVFWNLINKGIEMLKDEEKAREITIATTNFFRQIEWVSITVAYNGKVMRESVRKRIFEPSFTSKSVEQETDLGLALSYQIIVEGHGGMLRCKSTEKVGTEFIIEIPV